MKITIEKVLGGYIIERELPSQQLQTQSVLAMQLGASLGKHGKKVVTSFQELISYLDDHFIEKTQVVGGQEAPIDD